MKCAFLKNPDGWIEQCLQNRSLKGIFREAVRDAVLENQGNPEINRFSWILLLPRCLSLVSVDGCCNLSCRMCGGSKGKLEYLDRMRLGKILLHAPTAEIVTFVAGNSEPLMNPDMADNLLLIRDNNAVWDIVSNGHLLNDRLIEAMISDNNVSRLNISLDSCSETTYRSIRNAPLGPVLERLRSLRDAKNERKTPYPFLSLLMVGMEDNIEELPSFVELAAELQAGRVLLSHMLGKYKPGDFFKNPNWKTALRTAAEISRKTGVLLEMPHDARDLENAPVQTDPLTSVNGSSAPFAPAGAGNIPAAPGDALPEIQQKQFPAGFCPWLLDVHIQLNGSMQPCCNVGVPIGNIYDGPLYRNREYLETKTALKQGKVYKQCMPNLNCAYAGMLKASPTPPSFIN